MAVAGGSAGCAAAPRGPMDPATAATSSCCRMGRSAPSGSSRRPCGRALDDHRRLIAENATPASSERPPRHTSDDHRRAGRGAGPAGSGGPGPAGGDRPAGSGGPGPAGAAGGPWPAGTGRRGPAGGDRPAGTGRRDPAGRDRRAGPAGHGRPGQAGRGKQAGSGGPGERDPGCDRLAHRFRHRHTCRSRCAADGTGVRRPARGRTAQECDLTVVPTTLTSPFRRSPPHDRRDRTTSAVPADRSATLPTIRTRDGPVGPECRPYSSARSGPSCGIRPASSSTTRIEGRTDPLR